MPELFLIFSFITIVVLILTAGANAIHKRHLSYKERSAERADRVGSSRSDEDYQRLEERVRVLERIATDNNDDLALQIEQLRDFQQIDRLPRTEPRN